MQTKEKGAVLPGELNGGCLQREQAQVKTEEDIGADRQEQNHKGREGGSYRKEREVCWEHVEREGEGNEEERWRGSQGDRGEWEGRKREKSRG